MLIDIHTHLTYGQHDKDIDEVIERARKANVTIIVNAGTSPEQNRKSLKLAKKYDIVKPALGFYPIEMLEYSDEDIDKELKWISKQKPIALSEIGIDYHYDKTHHDKQKQNLMKFIKLSEKMKVPMIVHSRDAEQDVIDLLQSSNCKKVVMHCFSGTIDQLKKIYDNGWYISIPTSICLRKSFRKILKNIPLERVFTETDAPWMSPFPDVKRNEPAFIIEAVKKIAQLKKITFEETEKIVYMYYQKLFL